MKNLITSLVLFTSACSFGAIDDTTVVAGSKGPDKYADGSQVQVGECYALVWSQGEFAGFKADGSLVNADDLVFVILSRADEKGACDWFAYDVPNSVMKKGGNVSLWLLDTRTFAEDGSTNCYSVAGWDTKSVPLVSSAAKVDAEIKILDSGAKNISGYFGDFVTTEMPKDTPAPVIKSIKVENGYAIIQVENTVPFITYDLDAGKDPSALVDGNAEYPVNGATEKTQSITLIKKAKDASQFFKVRRKK